VAFLKYVAGFFDVQKTQSSTRLFAFIALMFAGLCAAAASAVAILCLYLPRSAQYVQFIIASLGGLCITFCALTREAIRLRTEVPASPLPPPAPPPVVTDPAPTIVTVTESKAP
jgi:hypothetical protein